MKPALASDRFLFRLTLCLGVFSFGTLLAACHIADGDLWAKLALGAHVWKFGAVPLSNMFAFTPVLPVYIDHECGAGILFFGALKLFGSAGLMLLKIILGFGALMAALAAGRRAGASWESLLLLAVPSSACLLLGYIPVLRSHTFTYCFFALTLLGLEEIRRGGRWPLFVLPPLMLVWSNVHGGFVAGLGALGVYTALALVTRQRGKVFFLITAACMAVTFINLNGLTFWAHLIPALLNPRPQIAEWRPLPLFASDIFNSFRILFGMVLVLVLAGWRRVERKNWPGLVMLALTAFLAWRSRRHAPFFAVAALAFVGPFLQVLFSSLAARLSPRARNFFRPQLGLLILYGALSLFVAARFLPQASFDVLAPLGHDPVREVDILSRAEAVGNLATPFGWGSYCSWRLYPRIQVSMDGRYEAAYPESTFQLNNAFYEKRGANWDRLIRDYPVDYVLLELGGDPLRPGDLIAAGYVLIWQNPGQSALLALPKHAEKLKQVAASLPPTTVNPFDAAIPEAWWPR